MAPYRESLSRLLVGTELSGVPYYLLTYASLALFYLVAMNSGSIWVPIQFVGATAGTVEGHAVCDAGVVLQRQLACCTARGVGSEYC